MGGHSTMSKQPTETQAHVLKRRTLEHRLGRLSERWVYWNPYGDVNHTADPRSAFVFGVEDKDVNHTVSGEWTVVPLDEHLRDMWDQAAEHEAMAKAFRDRCTAIEKKAAL